MSPYPLLDVSALAARLERFTVLDVRWSLGGPPGEEAHAAGHIPGAVYVDMETALADPPGGEGGRHPLPAPERFEAAMRLAGVSQSRPVVVYDDWQGRAAARAWWLLRHHGHEDVRVLDGGWRAWVAAGHPSETGAVSPRVGDFRVTVGAGMPMVSAEEVLGAEVLIDARAPERFSGAVEPVDPVAGHIPGAHNVPTDHNLDPQGRFLPAPELRERYAAVGAVPGVEVVAYCGSGITATHDILALEVAGVRAGLYAPSWSGWVADPSRPVETSGG